MSRENVELVRQALDALHRRDKAAFVALCGLGVHGPGDQGGHRRGAAQRGVGAISAATE